jgi:spore coat polysaccharide biosynthesis predicted glycosyltransferase SpsG/RimJ/RimL family protein N-acetyltransferase
LFAHKILAIDDLANRPHECDLLLDATLGRVAADYKDLVPETCDLLLGPRWALLRPEFAEHRARSLARRGAVPAQVLFVCFGASDPYHVAARLLRSVLDACPQLACVVVATDQTDGKLTAMARAQPERVRLHGPTKDMAGLMAEADLALGAAGTMSWERCAIGLPSAVVVVADNQRRIARELESHGAALLLGDEADVDPAAAATQVAALAADGNCLAAMSGAAAAVCDGAGARRTVEKISDAVDERVYWQRLLSSVPAETLNDGRRLSLRLATAEDEMTTYRWQCEPAARTYSRSPGVPTRQEHATWFAETVNSSERALMIIQIEDQGVGSMRLDRLSRGPGYEISIVVSQAFRGGGIGTTSLKLLRRIDRQAQFTAYVDAKNSASRKSFSKAGFVLADGATYVAVCG